MYGFSPYKSLKVLHRFIHVFIYGYVKDFSYYGYFFRVSDLCMLLSTREFTISLTQLERGHICVLRTLGSEMLIVGFS